MICYSKMGESHGHLYISQLEWKMLMGENHHLTDCIMVFAWRELIMFSAYIDPSYTEMSEEVRSVLIWLS